MAATRHNLLDQGSPNIKVVATLYSPSVIVATYRRAHMLGFHHAPKPFPEAPPIESLENVVDSEYVMSLDILMQEEAGLYVDWEKEQYVDAHGNYVRSSTQIDSLTFFVAIENNGWPCCPPMHTVGGTRMGGIRPVLNNVSLSDFPCYLPDISNLENHIYLVNDQNKFIRPVVVWGRRHSSLTSPENLVVKFWIGKDDYHFFEHSKDMRLIITEFDSKIMLEYPVSLLR